MHQREADWPPLAVVVGDDRAVRAGVTTEAALAVVDDARAALIDVDDLHARRAADAKLEGVEAMLARGAARVGGEERAGELFVARDLRDDEDGEHHALARCERRASRCGEGAEAARAAADLDVRERARAEVLDPEAQHAARAHLEAAERGVIDAEAGRDRLDGGALGAAFTAKRSPGADRLGALGARGGHERLPPAIHDDGPLGEDGARFFS